MTDLAVVTMPITDRALWDDWMDDVTGSGDTNADHREYLRNHGISEEHVFTQETPEGTMMILIWQGITQEQAGEKFQKVTTAPATEHERYMVQEFMPKAHGIDPQRDTPPAPPRHVATIEA